MNKKPNILLTNGYFYPLDDKQWKTAQPYPPLGTLWAGAQLRKHEYSIDFVDNCLEPNANKLIHKLQKSKPNYVIIYDDGFNYLTKMCLTVMRDEVMAIINEANQIGAKVIISSSDSTDHYGQYLEKGADFILLGEGEETIVELIETLEQNQSYDTLLGIAYKDKLGNVVKNARRPVIKTLDELPLPAWDLIDITGYRDIWNRNHGYFSLNLATTRGCPYKCNWCAKPIYGNRYNTRTPAQVIEEIEWVQSLFKVDYFWMCDDIFGLKPNWVQEFDRIKKQSKLQFKYKIQSRVDLMLKEDNLDALANSGADIIWVGAESGSQKILDAMDKGTQVEQIYEATKKLKERDVKVAFFLQFGYPGENLKDIWTTIKMVLDLMPDEIGISVSYPLPGTKFYEAVKNQLNHKANWKDSDDLDLMFENTYPPVFYKTLHRYVHNRYHVKKGFSNIFRLFSGSIIKNLKSVLKLGYHIPMSLYRGYLLRRQAIAQ